MTGVCHCPPPKCTCSCHPVPRAAKTQPAAEQPSAPGDYATTSSLAFRDRAGIPRQRAINPDHTADHLKPTAPFEGSSTYKIDYLKKNASVSRGVPSVDPYVTNLKDLNTELSDAEWQQQLMTTKREAFQAFPITTRAAKDPKLWESHIAFGNGQGTYATTSDSMLVHHPPQSRVGPAMTKTELQRTSIPQGDVEEWKKDLVSSAQENFVGRPGARAARFNENPMDSHIDIAKGGRGIYNTTHRDDYVEKHGPGYERSKPIINPHTSSVPIAGDDKPELNSLSHDSFDKKPYSKRDPFHPNLQGAHFSLGNSKPGYDTTSGQTFTSKMMKPSDRAVLAKPDLQKTSIREGEPVTADTFRTTQMDSFSQWSPNARPAASLKDAHIQTSIDIGGKDGIWHTTHRDDFTEKRAHLDRGAPMIDPKAVHITNPMNQDEWAKELTTVKRDDYRQFKADRSAPYNPNLQKSNIYLGSDNNDYRTTTGTGLFDHKCHACCGCVTKGQLHA